MDGSLATTPADDVLRTLVRDGATGTLHLDTPYGRARVVIDGDRVVAAWSPTQGARLGERLVGAGHLTHLDLRRALTQQDDPTSPRIGALLVADGLVSPDAIRLFAQEQILDALFEVVGWRAGSFSFEHGRIDSPPEIPVAIPMAAALAEVDRRRREWRRLQELIPSLASIPHAAHSAGVVAALESDETAVLAHLDGHRSIRDLAVELGYGPFETARIVYGLATAGLVEVTEPAEASDATSDVLPVPEAAPAHLPLDDTPPPELYRPMTDAPTNEPLDDTPPPEPDRPEPVGEAEAAGVPALALTRKHPARDANIAEILRELSRLAREPAAPAEGSPAPRADRESDGGDADAGRKRRFGRGS
jgi:hypothetical protein